MKKGRVIGIVLNSVLIAFSAFSFAYSMMLLVNFSLGGYYSLGVPALVAGFLSFPCYAALFIVLIVYPYISKKENLFITLCQKHRSFFVSLELALTLSIMAAVGALIFRPSSESLMNFINLQWVIFGIAVALYTILYSKFTMNDLKKASVIRFDNAVFTFGVFVAEGFLLLLTTTFYYIIGWTGGITAVFANIAFVAAFFAVSQILLDTIFDTVRNKTSSAVESGVTDDRNGDQPSKPKGTSSKGE